MQYPTKLQYFNFRDNDPNLEDYKGTSIKDHYFQGWQAAFQYCYDVLSGIRKASANEKLFCKRFVDDLSRTDITLDLDNFKLLLIIANSLKHSKGPLVGTRIRLMPWQQFLLLNLFCFVYSSEDPERAGERRFRKVFAFIPRGNAKTQLAAIVAVYSILTTENGKPTVTTSASTRKQASICFEEIKAQIKSSSKYLKKKFKCRTHDILLNSDSGGSLYATSSEAGSIEGERLTTGILDEVHTHPDSKIHDVVSSSMQSSNQPILFCITTAGTNVNSFCHDLYSYAVGVLKGEITNDQFLSIIYESDEEEPNSEIGYEQANPSLDHAVSRQAIRAEYQSSLMSPSAAANFATKHLNKWHQFAESGFVDTEIINNCFTSKFPSEDELKELPCYMGLDLAAVSDLSSIVRVHIGKDHKLYVKSQSFIPHNAYESLPMNLKNIYMKGINSKSLRLCGTKVTDLEEIKDEIRHYYKTYTVEDTGIDAAQGGERFAEEYQSETGYELAAVNQGWGLSDAAFRLLRGMTLGNIVFDENDHMMRWCIVNGRTYIGQHGDMKIIKSSNDALKIDCLVALLVAMAMIPAVEQGFGITLV
ncbi:terminase large subunit [Aeromonas caviae]|uniref:terminase large subunit n=1 Tax=Aeromonas caviae TaxID=648 RepID=UPI0029DA180C|nr:terminase large subunit [Aeromonas caviae]MDX7833838.1 terminase large subunit [Aeromonas caviae]